MRFDTFDFHPHVAAGIAAAGFVTPTPIQRKAIPPVMEGRDVIGLAQTGTGKTAAFVLPILHRLVRGPRGRVRALIVAPTRELAEQTHYAIETMGRRTRLRSVTVYGGVGINPQVMKLKRGAEIVVACPGRLLDHMGRKTVDLSRLELLVLDEADRMFDMGFLPDIRRILKHLPSQRQTLLFSATMPHEIRLLARKILDQPVTVQIGATAPADTVSHALYPVKPHLKTAMLLEILDHTDTNSVLVFTRTKHRAKRLGEQLGRTGYKAASLQGNLSQRRRQAALDGFRNGTYQILVATDVAARGLDVTRVSHVINYDMPDTADAYVHRIGRTGRAARNGDAFTLVTADDGAMVGAIERILGGRVEHRTVDGFNYAAPAKPRKRAVRRPQGQRVRGHRPFASTKAAAEERGAGGARADKAKAFKGNRKQGRRPARGASGQQSTCRAQRGGPFYLG
ncbi:MAG: DEAD/DEAH box helicase [Thermodesulfobacteriota bacterium]|nr:DEAD/DEAH box helicase [Thermodesulfobacteriota bacterium]